uniref:Uncharacterized protein n=1 Tax=Cacopsylla melanoneura TaxID=428564 RepID=A0A8D9F063_9HEMI
MNTKDQVNCLNKMCKFRLKRNNEDLKIYKITFKSSFSGKFWQRISRFTKHETARSFFVAHEKKKKKVWPGEGGWGGPFFFRRLFVGENSAQHPRGLPGRQRPNWREVGA